MALFGKTASRLEELEKVLARDPASRQFLALADEQRRAGRLREAYETLQRGLRHQPGHVAAHVAFGRVCQQVGRLEEALDAYLSALSLDRENLVALRQSAELLLNKGDKVEAVKRLKLYRALCAGEKGVTETIERLDAELGFVPAQGMTDGLLTPSPSLDPSPLSLEPGPPPEVDDGIDVGADAVPALPALPEALSAEPAQAEAPLPVPFLEAEVLPAALAAPTAFPVEGSFEQPFGDYEEPTLRTAPAPAATEGPGLFASVPAAGPLEEPSVTETLAELYAAQGYVSDARAAFEALARRATDPSRAARLMARAQSLGGATSRKASLLREWADRLARSRPAPPEEDMGETLRSLVGAGTGILAAVLADDDGLPVLSAGEGACSPGFPGSPDELLAAELSAFCKAARRSRDEVGSGDLEWIALSGPEGGAVVARVSPGYSLILRTAPGASRGRAKFLAARAADRLAPALS